MGLIGRGRSLLYEEIKGGVKNASCALGAKAEVD